MSNHSLSKLTCTALGLFVITGAQGATPSIAQATGNPKVATKAPAPLTRALFMKRLESQFQQMDKDGNGKLDSTELGSAEERLVEERVSNVTKKATERFHQLDSNHDGQLSLAEFTSPISRPKNVNPSAAMSRLDTNKDGKISSEEYLARPLSNFDRLDTNHDGTLSPAERSAAAKKK